MKPEAGWYPDPTNSGQLRWWDGNAWTAQTRSAAGAVPAASQEAAPAQRSDSSGSVSSPQSGPESSGTPNLTKAEYSGDSARSGDRGQSQYGQPEYGQPQYGQPDHSQSGYASAGSDQSGYGSTGYSQPGQGQSQQYGNPQQYGQGQYGDQYAQQYGQASPYGQYASATGYPGTNLGLPGGLQLAGQGWRLLARIIDNLLIGLVAMVLCWSPMQDYLAVVQRTSASGASPLEVTQDPAYTTFVLSYTVVLLVLNTVYEAVMIRLKGATVGKMICKIQVISKAGGRPGWGQSILRPIVILLPNQFTCSIWGLVDSLWCLWDPRRDCLHDKIVKTSVATKGS